MLHYAYYESPIGLLEIKAGMRGIRSVKKVEHREQQGDGPHLPVLDTCIQQLEEYFQGDRSAFDLPLDFGDAPEFNQAVWRALLEIPYGHTTSYLAIAEKLDNPKAVRAVGQANRYNPIAIIVPCHRVIAKTGDLQGYFYGLDVKRRLLEIENPMSFAQQGSLF